MHFDLTSSLKSSRNRANKAPRRRIVEWQQPSKIVLCLSSMASSEVSSSFSKWTQENGVAEPRDQSQELQVISELHGGFFDWIFVKPSGAFVERSAGVRSVKGLTHRDEVIGAVSFSKIVQLKLHPGNLLIVGWAAACKISLLT